MTTATTSRTRVIRDTNHPDFPHGEVKGRSRGCICDPCMNADRNRAKKGHLDRARGIRFRSNEDLDKRTIAHIDDLMKTPGVTLTDIARAAGVAKTTVGRLYTLRGRTSVPTATKILAVTRDQIDSNFHVDPTRYLKMIHGMQALGYSLQWQSRQSGHYVHNVVHYIESGARTHIERPIAEAIEALASRVGDRVATVADGMTPHGIRRTIAVAREHGHYPPAAYNEDGTLDWRAIPDHPWTTINESCHEHIERLELALRNHELGAAGLTSLTLGYTSDAHADGTPEHAEFVRLEMAFRRLLEGLGIRAIDGGRERRAELHEALWKFMRRGEGDPVSFCIENGIISANSTKIPSDHPAVAEQRAKEAEERAEARRESRRAANADPAAKEARNRRQQALRARMTPEEREAYNERKRATSRNRRATARDAEQVAA